MTEYIKYSERQGIKDPFLAKLVDHIERVVGWDIETMNTHNEYTSINSGKHNLYIYEWRVAISIDGSVKFEMEQKVFEQEYTSLLSHYKK